MTAWPARTSRLPPVWSTLSRPWKTIVYSSNSGVWPGSSQPPGLRMRATLSASWRELTRPMYSSITLGRFPAAATRVGFSISVGMTLSSSSRPPVDVVADLHRLPGLDEALEGGARRPLEERAQPGIGLRINLEGDRSRIAGLRAEAGVDLLDPLSAVMN